MWPLARRFTDSNGFDWVVLFAGPTQAQATRPRHLVFCREGRQFIVEDASDYSRLTDADLREKLERLLETQFPRLNE